SHVDLSPRAGRSEGRTSGEGKRASADLGDHLRGVLGAVSGAVGADDVIVAKPGHHRIMDVGRMHDDVHVFLDRPWLVAADQWPLDKIVALAMAIEPRFF